MSKMNYGQCLICGEDLNFDYECPNGCTEADDYGCMEGFESEEYPDFDYDIDP